MEENTAQTENLTTQPVNPVSNVPPSTTPPDSTPPKIEPVKTENPPFMPRKTLLLIGVLFLITIILLGLALYIGLPKTNNTPQKQVNVLKTALSISEPVASASAYTANVTLTTERKKVTAVQIELNYDPKTITNVDIKPGGFFPNPTILLKKIDPVNGRISYVLGIGLGQYPINGNGTVAVLSLTPVLQSGATTISFLPKSEVTVAGEIPSVLTSAQGVKFFFGPTPTVTPTKNSSPSAR